jgi:cytochrome c-type biogenesis protein CcmH
MKRIRCTFLCLLIVLGLVPYQLNFAQDTAAKPLADNPQLEAQVMEIAVQLRCLVCQNETIAGSHADLAIDLRNQIRTQLSEGKSERDILDYMVKRYGDFVLYKPPVKTNTLFLWFGPLLLLLFGLSVLVRHVSRQKTIPVENDSPQNDLEQARELLSASRKDPL